MKEKLIEKLASLKADAQAIIDTAATDTDGVFTDEQNAKFDAITAEITKVKTQIDKIDALNEVTATIEAPKPRKTVESNVRIIKEAYADQGGFRDYADFFTAVKDAAVSGSLDKRLEPYAAVGSDEQRYTSNPVGGFLIEKTFLRQLLKTDGQELQFDTGTLTTNVPISNMAGVKIPARVDKTHTTSVSGGFTVSRRAETEAITTSTATFEQIDLTPTALAGATYATQELMMSDPVMLGGIIASSFNDEFTSKLNAERITGTGVGTYLGIANSDALITVTKETDQTADTVNYDNIVKMYARCYRPSQAVWMCNHTVLPQLMTLEDTEGRLIWQPSAREGVPGTLLGRPVYMDENCEAVGDLGDIYFVNWKEYLEGAVGGTTVAESVHVRFLYNENCYKFVRYNAGKPWWTSVLTPKNGSTLSPFVTLAARA